MNVSARECRLHRGARFMCRSGALTPSAYHRRGAVPAEGGVAVAETGEPGLAPGRRTRLGGHRVLDAPLVGQPQLLPLHLPVTNLGLRDPGEHTGSIEVLDLLDHRT